MFGDSEEVFKSKIPKVFPEKNTFELDEAVLKIENVPFKNVPEVK
jgi:hypothetical protein